MSLPALRRRIDQVDRKLLRLLNQRAKLALRVGRVKVQRQLPVIDRRREQAVLRQVSTANGGPLSRAAIQAVFREVLRQNRRLVARGRASARPHRR